MSDSNENTPPSHVRRGSISAQILAAARAKSQTGSSPTSNTTAMSSAQAQAAQQHARRLSVSTLGLSGAGAGGSSPAANSSSSASGRSNSVFDALGMRRAPSVTEGQRRARHASISEHADESAVLDDLGPSVSNSSGAGAGSPGASLGRRMSQGAQAYSKVRSGSGSAGSVPGYGAVGPLSPPATNTAAQNSNNNNSRKSTSDSSSSYVNLRTPDDFCHYPLPPQAEGYNFGESFRARAQRNSTSGPGGPGTGTFGGAAVKKSAAEAPAPAPEPPKQSKLARAFQGHGEDGKLDHTQERMLRGDFSMD